MAAEVDWKQAPREARWWAMDGEGKAHWHFPPTAAAFTSFWWPEPPQAAPDFGYEGDWKASLTERPPKENRGGKG